MKISSATLDLQSSHASQQQLQVKESLRVWIDRAQAERPAPPRQTVSISPAARDLQSNDSAALAQAPDEVNGSPKMQLILSLVEMLTGQKVKLYKPEHGHTADSPSGGGSSAAAATPRRAGFSAECQRTVSYHESEQTTFHASGTVKTSDGKEIQFDLSLSMQREFSMTSSTSLRLGDAPAKQDPLVINFNGTAAQLSEQRFSFDLNSDGKTEQINSLRSGSGFLALDTNSDGKINNGSELFGTVSGNGYADLALYDGDGNGWIDENDSVYSKLKVWTPGGEGGGQLSSLAQVGIGALSLSALATPFDLKTADNQLLGSVRASSVVLNENGTAGTMQQVDLVV
ncbi:MAG: VCBS repeat-containing protein [Nitrosomonadales bacterium]|nr:VCBS repeat-containing protein [Nitrosomonadales bacterium]